MKLEEARSEAKRALEGKTWRKGELNMKTKSSKRNLRYRKEGKRWEWTTDKDWDIYYCTSNEGDGIVRIDCVRNECNQLVGTLQFSVSGLTDASAKRKIREYMKNRGEWKK